MIFLKRFKRYFSLPYKEQVDRTHIININRLCYGYNTNLSYIDSSDQYFNLKYLHYGYCLMWMVIYNVDNYHGIIRELNIMPLIAEYDYLSKYEMLSIDCNMIFDTTKIIISSKPKQLTYDLFDELRDFKKTSKIEYVLSFKITVVFDFS